MPFAISRFIAVVSALAMLLVAAVPSVSAQTTGCARAGRRRRQHLHRVHRYTAERRDRAGGRWLPGLGLVRRQDGAGLGRGRRDAGLARSDGCRRHAARARGAVGQNRPDVGAALGNPFYAASGFYAGVPGSSVPAGAQTLNVYLHTPAKGWWYRSVNVVGGGSGGGSGTGTSGGSSSAATTGAPF